MRHATEPVNVVFVLAALLLSTAAGCAGHSARTTPGYNDQTWGRPAPHVWFNRYCAHWSEIDDDFVDYSAAVKPQVVQVGFFGPEYYSARAYMEEKNMDKLWAPLGGGPRDQAWWRGFIAKEHAQGVKVVGMFSIALVFGDDKADKGWFDYWDNRWDEKTLGPQPRAADGSRVKAVSLMQLDTDGRPHRSAEYKIEGGAEYSACPNNPYYREALKRFVKVGIDLGLDGFQVIFPHREECTCEYCQAGFRKFLGARYTPAQIKEKFGIDDLPTHRFASIHGFMEPEVASPLALETLKFSQFSVADCKREVFLEYGRSIKPDLMVGEWNHIYHSTSKGQFPGTFAQLNADEQCSLPTEIWSRNENWVWYSIGNWMFGNEYYNPAKGLWGQFSLEHKYLREAGGGVPQVVKRDDAVNIHVYIAEAVAHGGFGYARGPNYKDAPTRATVARYFDFLQRHEDLYHPIESPGEVALVFPRSAVHSGDTSGTADFKQMGFAMTAKHVQFDVAVDELLTPERRSHYLTVLEPKHGELSDLTTGSIQAVLQKSVVDAPTDIVAVEWLQPARKRVLLHLVNYKRGPYPGPKDAPVDNPLPQENIAVHLPLPAGSLVKSVTLLSPDDPGDPAERKLEFTQDAGVLHCKVDKMLVYSVVVADLQ